MHLSDLNMARTGPEQLYSIEYCTYTMYLSDMNMARMGPEQLYSMYTMLPERHEHIEDAGPEQLYSIVYCTYTMYLSDMNMARTGPEQARMLRIQAVLRNRSVISGRLAYASCKILH
jgi:hypothetical protein